MAPPKPTRPATLPSASSGTRSVGRIITSVDQDCWPKKARLKITITQATDGRGGTKITHDNNAALAPNPALREKFPARPHASSQFKTPPPHRQPMPDAA